jgi:hypothetical protein
MPLRDFSAASQEPPLSDRLRSIIVLAALAAALAGAAACSGTTAKTKKAAGGVLQHHNNLARDGVYIEPAFTKTAVTKMHLDPTFANATVTGSVFAQPLYLNGITGKPDLVIAATMANHVYAFDAASGKAVWDELLGPPGVRAAPDCSPFVVGITGTPVIDDVERVVYVDAYVSVMGDGGAVNRHQIFALDADTGHVRSGWPVTPDGKVRVGTLEFNSHTQNQRGALLLLNGTLYVPYGGFGGDCGMYRGWIIGVSTSDPTRVSAWATRVQGGGIWSPAGLSSDGTSIYFATGNTSGANGWQDGEAIFKLGPSLAPTDKTTDYFAPINWGDLDRADADLGSTTPVIVDAPGSTPSKLLMGYGKDLKSYVVDRENLGGISAPVTGGLVAQDHGIAAPTVYTTPTGTYFVFTATGLHCPPGKSGRLVALLLSKTAPPVISTPWCGLLADTQSAPSTSMTDAKGTDALIWIMGLDNKLHALDGDGGFEVFAGGTDTIPEVVRYTVPIIAKGRVFVASTTQIHAFTVN